MTGISANDQALGLLDTLLNRISDAMRTLGMTGIYPHPLGFPQAPPPPSDICRGYRGDFRANAKSIGFRNLRQNTLGKYSLLPFLLFLF